MTFTFEVFREGSAITVSPERAVLTTAKTLYFDSYKKNKNTGSFILIHLVTNNSVAVGMIIDKMGADELPSRITDVDREKINKGSSLISNEEYRKRYNQKGATLWITDLYGSGNNLLAYTLKRRLFDLGAIVVLLDGSTIKSGLSKELDFSPSDQTEHLRRVAYLAKTLNDQGVIVICSFILPSEDIHNLCTEIVGKEKFYLLYMNADLVYCLNHKTEFHNVAQKKKLYEMYGMNKKVTENVIQLVPEKEELNIRRIVRFLTEHQIISLHKH